MNQSGLFQGSNREIEKERDHYHELYEFAPVGYLTITLDGVITDINLTGAKLLGTDREQLIHKDFVQFVADGDKDLWNRCCLHAGPENNTGCEFELRRADGSAFFAHLDCQSIATDDAKPLVSIAMTDITAHKLAEESLRIAAAAFETQIGIMVTDAQKEVIRVNQAFTRITGYSVEETLGRKPSFLQSRLHDEVFYRAMWRAIAHDHSWQGEVWDVRKSGEIFPVFLTITAISGADGVVTHYVGSFTDITAQKKTEQGLLESRQNLESEVASVCEWNEKIKTENANVNAALKVLLSQLESKMSDSQCRLSLDLEKTVLPFLKKIRKLSHDPQQIRLLDIIESNLEHLIQSYGSVTSVDAAYHKLTPTEIQVATMVRQGLPTKAIATALNLAQGTVSIHRKRIRRKLGLESKAANLHCYLSSLTEKKPGKPE
ncbi:MAG: PAS domain S-box protein [Gammaproteobacteria bacterium]